MTHDVSDTLQLRFLVWSGVEVCLGDTRLLLRPGESGPPSLRPS